MLELRQKLLLLKDHNSGVFRCFERKMELQEMVPLGGHPPHPPRRGHSMLSVLCSGRDVIVLPIVIKSAGGCLAKISSPN